MSMRMLFTALLAAVLAGCGSGGPAPGQLPPHGGTLLSLTGADGFVEVVRDGSRVVVYFLGPDRKPIATAPTDVRLTLQGKGEKPLDLKPMADPDPAKSGGLAAAAPDDGDISGTLTAKVGGKVASAAINVR
jgi:hypothetical protein